MIIFLHGEDDYRREEKRKELAHEFERRHPGFGLERFDLEVEGDADRLRVFLRGQSMFDPVRMAVVSNVYAGEGAALVGELERCLANKTTTVLLSERDAPPKKFGFLLLKPVLSQKFAALRGADWFAFVKQEAARHGATVSDAALRIVAVAHEGDSWGLVTELLKLRSLPHVSETDLKALGVELAPDFWGLLMRAKNGRVADRLSVLERLLDSDEPAGKIFNILAYQWAERLPEFAEYDVAVKSGELGYEEALVDLFIR